MCLEVTAIPRRPGRVGAGHLSAASGLWVTKLGKASGGAFYFALEPGCSCSLLSEEADWNEATWALVPEALTGLSEALGLLAQEAGGFSFQALWIGDEPETRAHTSLRELLKDVRGNRVKNKHVYEVGGAVERSDAPVGALS